MSITEANASRSPAISLEPDQTGLRRAGPAGWIWAIVACSLLAISGGVRVWQDRRFEQEKGYLEDCPFPLATLPSTLGGWRLLEGGDQPLDNETIRITGSTEHIQRFYVDELTGVTMGVLVLFGPAEPVLPHTPQVCYPATGYTEIEEPNDRDVKGENGQRYQFRTAVYGKSGGRAMIRTEVFHSYRLDGRWSPSVGVGRKFPRKNPGIFKVQVHRLIGAGERRDQDNPIEQFVGLLIPEIEKRIVESQAKPAPKTPPIKPSTPDPKAGAVNLDVTKSRLVARLDGDGEPASGH